MRRTVYFFLMVCFFLGLPQARSATPPGSEQSGSSNSNNTAAIVAVGTVGVIILGGLLWWRFHQPPGFESRVIIRKPQGSSPRMAFADFRDDNLAATRGLVSQKVRTLLYQSLKCSQAYNLIEPLSAGQSPDSILLLVAKVSVLTNFSQAEVSISRKGEALFLQTITWFDERELRRQVVNLTNLITEQVK